MWKYLKDIDITSSQANRSWLKTNNMTSATPNLVDWTTFKLVKVNENWEFVVDDALELVQPDWQQTDSWQPDYIQNKPVIQYADYWSLPVTGDTNIIYVTQDTNVLYRRDETTSTYVWVTSSSDSWIIYSLSDWTQIFVTIWNRGLASAWTGADKTYETSQTIDPLTWNTIDQTFEWWNVNFTDATITNTNSTINNVGTITNNDEDSDINNNGNTITNTNTNENNVGVTENYDNTSTVTYEWNVNFEGNTSIDNLTVNNITFPWGNVFVNGIGNWEVTDEAVSEYSLVATPMSEGSVIVWADSGTGLFPLAPASDYTYDVLLNKITFSTPLGTGERAYVWILSWNVNANLGWGGWSSWSVFINWTRQEQTFNHTIPSSDVCLLTETPIDKNAIFVFKKDSWLSWFNTVDYTYNETTNVVKLNTPLTYPQEVLIKYMIQKSSFEPIEQTPNTSWIYGWILQKPLMVYKNWLYMHENIDYSFLWTTLTFVEPTRLTDIIIFIM